MWRNRKEQHKTTSSNVSKVIHPRLFPRRSRGKKILTLPPFHTSITHNARRSRDEKCKAKSNPHIDQTRLQQRLKLETAGASRRVQLEEEQAAYLDSKSGGGEAGKTVGRTQGRPKHWIARLGGGRGVSDQKGISGVKVSVLKAGGGAREAPLKVCGIYEA